MVFYLDTSAVNHLFDHQSSLLSPTVTLAQNAKAYISVFTVAELASESDECRRKELLTFAKELSRKFRPAAMPGELLRRSLESVQCWARDMDQSMASKWDGIWLALNKPELIDDEAYQEIIEWKGQQENWYQKMHSRGRSEVQAWVAKLPREEQLALDSKFSRLIQYYLTDSEFITDFTRRLSVHWGADVAVDEVLAQRVVKHSEHWRFFLASMAHGMYVRSVRTRGFSKRKTPGSIDTQQAIYLAICDVFVTADQNQHRMLRLVAPFGHKKRQIWSYTKFEQWLLEVD